MRLSRVVPVLVVAVSGGLVGAGMSGAFDRSPTRPIEPIQLEGPLPPPTATSSPPSPTVVPPPTVAAATALSTTAPAHGSRHDSRPSCIAGHGDTDTDTDTAAGTTATAASSRR